MTKDFRLPDLGEGVHEGQIVRLLAAEGDTVIEDQPLMEVETDKAAVEIPSPVAGTVAKWHVAENQTVNVGDVMITFDTAAEAAAPAAAGARVNKASSGASSSATAVARRPVTGRKPASPAVRKLARQLGVDMDDITGSGPGGRVSREDVERAAAESTASESSAARSRSDHSPSSRTPAMPRVMASLPEPTGSDQYGPISAAPLSQARKTIARVMSEAAATIPHVTDTDDADVTDLEALRRGHSSQEGSDESKLTLLAFVVRAVARALRAYPEFNASFDAEHEQIVYRHYINIAVGVHTDRGLIAPVIRNADALDVLEIAASLQDIATKARAASFAVNDTRGGTYTISNAGAFGGSRYSTPIITPGQVAVLAVGRSRQMPWVVNGNIVPRLIMPLSHSIDHRLLDGGQEIAFLRHVIADLEQPGRLVWERNGRR